MTDGATSALANTCCEINLFINNGGNVFTRTDIPGNFNDITASDINLDGRLDLAAVSGSTTSARPDRRQARWSCCSATEMARFGRA